MAQRYNGNTKRPQLKKNQPGFLNIYVICWKIQQRHSGPGDSTAGVIYLFMRIHPESCCISPLKVAATLFSGSRMQLEHSTHMVKVGVEATCQHFQAMTYKQLNLQALFELCHRNPGILDRVLNQITLSNSTVGKCAITQVIKQAEHGRTSTTKEEK